MRMENCKKRQNCEAWTHAKYHSSMTRFPKRIGPRLGEFILYIFICSSLMSRVPYQMHSTVFITVTAAIIHPICVIVNARVCERMPERLEKRFTDFTDVLIRDMNKESQNCRRSRLRKCMKFETARFNREVLTGVKAQVWKRLVSWRIFAR